MLKDNSFNENLLAIQFKNNFSAHIHGVAFKGGPRPLNGIYFQKLYATLGSSIDLSVNVTGYPLPKSEWTFISTTKKTFFSSFMGTNTSLNITTCSYQLRKTSIEEDEFGLYTLHLINDIGKFTTYFYVLTEVSKGG